MFRTDSTPPPDPYTGPIVVNHAPFHAPHVLAATGVYVPYWALLIAAAAILIGILVVVAVRLTRRGAK
jgi:hypothetical protein